MNTFEFVDATTNTRTATQESSWTEQNRCLTAPNESPQVPASKRVTAVSPVMFLKSEKNAVEAAGMKNAHLKDAVALCDFLSQMDDEVSPIPSTWIFFLNYH